MDDLVRVSESSRPPFFIVYFYFLADLDILDDSASPAYSNLLLSVRRAADYVRV